MTEMTRMERTVELIQILQNHPHRAEILSLAKQQLEDMFTYDVVKQNNKKA